MANRISEQEIAKAKKLALRKSGVTVCELVEALKLEGPKRARAILSRVRGLKVTRFGKGKGNRAKVFTGKSKA